MTNETRGDRDYIHSVSLIPERLGEIVSGPSPQKEFVDSAKEYGQLRYAQIQLDLQAYEQVRYGFPQEVNPQV